METLQREQLASVESDQKERLYHDTTTWLAEALKGYMNNAFNYSFDGQELYSSDGTPIGTIFEDALNDADKLPTELSFEKRRRQHELDEYHEMLEMMSGANYNTMVVISDFPPELMNATKDVGGYNTDRKQTMMRVLSKNEDGALTMRSQTLDGSNRQGLEAIYESLGFEAQPGELLGQRMHLDLDREDQEFLDAQLTGVYDRKMEEQFGGEYHAGREQGQKLNTYNFVVAQQDVLQVYFDSVKKFGEQPSLLSDIVATIDRRYAKALGHAGSNNPEIIVQHYSEHHRQGLISEMLESGRIAQQQGVSFSGCGLTLGGSEQTAEQQMGELGFGNNPDEDKYGSLKFDCPKGHTNRRPRNQLIEKCQRCGVSVKC